jgi:hypothetical protein
VVNLRLTGGRGSDRAAGWLRGALIALASVMMVY